MNDERDDEKRYFMLFPKISRGASLPAIIEKVRER